MFGKIQKILSLKAIKERIGYIRTLGKVVFVFRFDDCIADALELGALRREPINLTEKQKQWLKESTPEDVPLYVSEVLLEYHLANKPADSKWCIMPLTNIEAYLGSTSLSKSYMTLLRGKILERKDGVPSACVVRFLI